MRAVIKQISRKENSMGYRNIKPILTDIWKLSGRCGLFNGDTDLNNCYGCKSRSKNKEEPGKCFTWACPLGYTTSLDDLKEHDIDLYNEYKNGGHDPEQSDWMIQYREVV